LLAGALVLAAARPAAADGTGAGAPPEPTIAKADALFAEGVKLRDSNLPLACAKFGESLGLNPQAIGVLLNVAICDEKYGRVASAVRRYRETRERAVEQNFPEYQKAADAKLAELGPEVPYLTIRFDKPPLPQTKVVVDDRVVPLSELEELDVDPGERVVVISAPGRISFQRKISIARRDRRVLEVPPLQRPSPRRTIGKISFVAGAAAVATSVVLGYVAHLRYDSAINTMNGGMSACDLVGDELFCDGDVYGRARAARQLGTVSSIVGGAGLAAMLAGGYLWFFAPKPYTERSRVSVVPRVGPDGGGVAVFGRF
jgi:hypothetical protein